MSTAVPRKSPSAFLVKKIIAFLCWRLGVLWEISQEDWRRRMALFIMNRAFKRALEAVILATDAAVS